MSVAAFSESPHEDWEAETYLFSSAPATPRERTPDILVRFQAVCSDRPCLESKTVFISSQSTLIEARRTIQRHFQCLYERGFIFLRQHQEIGRSQERAVRLIDVLPKCKLGQPRGSFVFPDIQYKKLSIDREGRRSLVLCVGVAYICEASSERAWSPSALREELSGNPAFANCFAYVPAHITSANQEALDLKVDELNLSASTGDKDKLQSLIRLLPSDIKLKKVKDQRSATPLHYASQNGHVDICEALIGRFGYDILYMKDCNSRTPLHCALHAMKLEVVCYLLHLSPDLEWHDNLGFSCARMLHGLSPRDMHVLMTRLEPEVLDPQLVLQLAVFALTSRDAKQALRYCRLAPVVSAPFYRPPLHLAAELGDVDAIKALLSNDVVRKSPYRRKYSVPSSDSPENANISFETSGFAQGTSDLTQTPRSQEATYRLISNIPDREMDSGCTTARTDSGISNCSIKNGGKAKKKQKAKPKAKARDPDIVSELDILLEDVVDVQHSPLSRDSDGHLPFHYACQHGHHAALTQLYCDDMRQADFLKGVQLALNWKRYEVLQILPTLRAEYALDGELLSSVMKESERDICIIGHALLPLLRPHIHHLTRLLPYAAMTGAGDLVQVLLKMHVPSDTPDFLGRTPLHEACQQNRKHVVGVLLNEAGAEPNLRDWRGSTPLHYACAAGHLEVVEMLLESKRIIADCTDVRGRTPLLTAAHCNQQHVLSALVKRHLGKLSPLHCDVEGRNVLHYLSNVPADVMKELVMGVKELKQKGVVAPNEPFFPPQPYDSVKEAELRDIWDDPAHPHNKADVRGKHPRKNSQRKQRLVMTISCAKCGKSFSCTQRTINWYHVCNNPGQQGGPSSLSTSTLGRTLVRLPTFLPAGTEESTQDALITRSVQALPINRPPTPSLCELTPLDIAILNNKIDVMAELVLGFPELAKRPSTAVLAVRMANWEALRTLHKSSIFTKDFLTHLVHVACMQRPADGPSKSQFMKCLRLLFKLGASPNYIPDPKDFKADRLSPSEESLMPFMALEVAAILGDFDLADLLLECGASASICFAVHLAAFKGNTKMVKNLLPVWKEGRWKQYIKGFSSDANELVRICTLESGLVQAACASEQASMDLLKLVVEQEKDILVCKKILTHHMVFAIRPHVCSLSRPTMMNKILYKHIDDMAEDDHVCQHLPLSNLLRCPERNVRRKQVEMMAVYLLQQGAYLSEMRVSKKSQVHVACEVFVLGVKRRMWKLIEVLLIEAGLDIWACLLAPHHTCHKYVYRRWIDDTFVKRPQTDEWSGGRSGFLCLSKGMLRVFRLLPLNLLRQFLEKGKVAMKDSSLDGLRAVLMPRETGDVIVPRSPRSPRPPSTGEKPPALAMPASPSPTLPGSPRRRSTPRPESPCSEATATRHQGTTSPQPRLASPRSGRASSQHGSASLQHVHASIRTGHSTPTPGQASLIPGEASPSLGHASPNLECSSTNLGHASPNLGHASPNLGHASPNLGHASPNLGHASPNLGHASPNLGHTSPNLGHASPNLGHASPNLGHASPNLGHASPQPRESSELQHASSHPVLSSPRPGAAFPRPGASIASPRSGARSAASSYRAVLTGGELEAHVLLMTQLLAYHVQQAGGTRGQLMVLSKLTLLCPPLLARSLPILRFHLSRHTWLPHTPRHAVAAAIKKQGKTRKVIQALSHELMEVSLWTKLSALPVRQVTAIQEQGLTLLHVACLFGDTRLAKACLTVVVSPLSADVRSWSGLTALEVAAAQGSTRLLDVLVKNKAHAPKSILVAACVGKAYTDFYTEKSDHARFPDEKTKLLVVQWCAKSLREKIDLAYSHPKYGTVFDVVLKKHHWAIFDWLLSNTEAAPLRKLMARCREFAELAKAPELVITKMLKSLGEVFLVLPDDVIHPFFLALTLRADSMLERVVRRLMTLNYFSSHGRLLTMVTARGRHNETIMHNMCRVGHVNALKLFLCLFSQDICGNAEISDFLDAVDNSGCTPLWYCLALKRWTMAEYLMTSGIRVAPKRAVPDFCIKRSFALCRSKDDLTVKSVDKTRRRSSLVNSNNSSQVVELISPDCGKLLQVYKNPPPAMHILAPEEGPAKSMLVTSDSGFSTSEGDVTMMSVNESDADRRTNLRYLLSLIHYAGLKGATLVHAAAAVGDKDLLEGLVKSPYCSAQLAFSRTFSPFIYALANSRMDTVTACMQNGLGPYDDDPVSYTLARAVLAKCGVRDSELALHGMLGHQKVSAETCEAVMKLVSTRSPWSHKVRNICTHISATSHTCSEHDLAKMVREVVRAKKGVVSEVLLVAAGVTGKLWVFKAILDAVGSKAKMSEVCSRPIVPKASFTDLLYLFAPRRMTLEAYAPEYFDRMKILRCISSETRLNLHPQTLRAAIKKNLLPMLEMVIKDHIRNRMPLQPSSLWFESIFKASTIGDVHYVNTVCAANLNVKVNVLQSALLRALCLACLHRHKQIANRLLLFKLPLLTPVTDLPGEFYMQPQLALETAIEGGDSVVASLILQTMEETGISPSSDDILRAIFMAFRKGMEPIIDNLLMFAHYVAPNLVSIKVCHRLFLVAARSGHGRICSKFLNLEKLNVSAVDTHGFTALHYACMYNRASLVRAIIGISPSSVQDATPDGLTALDLARCMGNWELAFELIGDHSGVRGQGFSIPEIQGWMKRLLALNAACDNDDRDFDGGCPGSRDMSIHSIIRRGDDRAARCLLEVAQESMVSCMLDYYPAYPLFHLCAKHGCESSLQLLIRLIEAQPQIDNKLFLEHEVDGMIPLALAVRGGHVGCTELLIGAHFPTKWRLRKTEESILHIAARGGDEQIVHLVAERSSNSFLQAQDSDGLIPATTAVAYGNHHVVKLLLRGLRFAEKLHHAHLQTTYWCILCLLDMCVGWSKCYQAGRVVGLNRKGRNVFQRHRTESGFSVCSDVSARAVMGRVLHSAEGRECLLKWMTPVPKKIARRRSSDRPKPELSLFYSEGLGSRYNLSHTLDTLQSWSKAGASPEIIESALGSMQYADRGHRSELFLMLSHMTRFEAMQHVVRKGQDDLATYLYSKLHPAFESDQKVGFFRHACAQGLPSLAEAMMATDPDINFLAVPEKQGLTSTALDLALAFGHSKTAGVLLQKLEGETISESVTEMRALTPYLSVNLQWKLGMATVGDDAWKASMDFSLSRLSHVDMYLITHPADNSFPGTLLPRDIMAVSVCGKQLEVDHLSMKNCVAELGVDDTWLTAHMLSRAVLGRYHTEVNRETEDWKMIDKISLHCLPSSSEEEAKVILQGHKLHDVIKVEKHKGKGGSTRFSVVSGPLPLSLTTNQFTRQRLMQDVLPEFKRRLAVMHGLAMDVMVDWSSIEGQHDLDTQRHLIDILAGEHGTPALAGLVPAMENCVHLLKDMAWLVNRRSAQEVKKMVAHTKTIVVKFVNNLPPGRTNLDLPLESRVMWYFSLDKDGSLVYNTNLFPVYAFLNVAHTLFTCLAPSLQRFPDPPPNAWRSAFTPEPEPPREDASEAAEPGSDSDHQSVTCDDKSTVATNVSDVGGTMAPSDITADTFWNMESPGEDLSRLAPSPGEMRAPVPPLLNSKKKQQKVQLTQVEDDSGVVLDISWDSLAFLPEIKRLMNFIRNAMSREVDRVSDSYSALQPLDLGVSTVAIRTAFGQEGSGLDLTNNTLTITLHCYSNLDETWGVGAVDADSFFFEKRTDHLCSRWRTGSMQMSASLNRTTRHLTRALGFSVALPVAGQTTLELLCRWEGRQMTHPYKLLKFFLKSLGQNLSEGYVQAVITALSFSGHCWLVGKADVPSTQWCWVKMTDVAKRKPGERYLVLTHTDHGEALYHTMRGGDIVSSAPGALAGVWHRRDNGMEGTSGIVMKDLITDRVQLVTVDGHVFFTANSRATFHFMSSLPMSVQIGPATESPLTKALWFDDVFLRPMELGVEKTRALTPTHPSDSTVLQCWRMASSLGFHLVFDLADTASEDVAKRDHKCLMCARLMLETLRDITDMTLCQPEVVKIVTKLLSALGTVTVSHKQADRAQHIVRGGMYDEEVNVYLVTERDLHLTPLPSVWDWDRHKDLGWPKPFTETLRCALCAAFSVQTRADLSTFFYKKLSRQISADDISFIEFADRPNKLQTLAMSHEAVTGFFSALTHFVERYLSGMRKLKSDLTSVVFTEEVAAGPVVSLGAGVLKVGLFKGGRPVERQMFVRDLLVAVAVDEDIDEEDLAPSKRDTPSVMLLARSGPDDTCQGLSVASSMRRRTPKVKHIVKAPSESKYTVERAVTRLLNGAEAGKTGDITDSLDIGASVNSVNENDESALLLAAKGRNYVIQELLLGRGADVNLADQAGMTALHYEAGHGDCEAVKMLLAHGADPNSVDVMGRTPLHYSVNNAHTETSDALVFCGADASIVNVEGRTPRALCQNRAEKVLMRRSDVTVKGLATGNVMVEHLILEADTAYTPDGIGISLKTPPTLGQVKTRLMLRRVTPEYSTSSIVPVGKEQLLSDTYEFRLSGARIEGSMILRIPVLGRPGNYDDVFVKTDTGAYSAPLRAVKHENDQCWVCHVRMNLSDVHALILVTKPRVERFSVTSSGGDYTSSLDSRLRVHVLQNTFKGSHELALEVLTSPTFEEEEFDNVMSLSHFYSLTSVSEKPQRPLNEVIISIPLPDNFFNQGDLFVLLRRAKAAGKAGKASVLPQEQWDVISKNPDVLEGMVKFRTPDLGLFCLMEKSRPTPLSHLTSTETSAIRYVSRLHHKAEQGEHDVVVFAMARPSKGSGGMTKDLADVVVEVTLAHKLHSRLEAWKAQGYVDNKPSFSNNFTAQPAQEFIISVGGCCQDADPHLSTLLFHPKRENVMRFMVAQRHLPVTMESWVDVFTSSSELPRALSVMTTVSGVSKVDSTAESDRRKTANHVSKLMLRLPWPRTQEQQEEERLIKFAALSPFTEDQNTGILQAVAWGLGSDWVKVAILLGVAPSAVSALRNTTAGNDGHIANQMLEQWRDSRASRQDRGVFELLVTLQKAGREDLVKVALNRLRNWLSEHGITGSPMAELILDKSLCSPRKKDVNEMEPETPEPMSGIFLRALSQEIGSRFDLAADLGISRPEMDTIMADPLLTCNEDKMFKLLLLSREKHEKCEDALQTVLTVTGNQKLTAVHNWVVETCKRWIVLQGAQDNHFAHEVGEILYNISGAT